MEDSTLLGEFYIELIRTRGNHYLLNYVLLLILRKVLRESSGRIFISVLEALPLALVRTNYPQWISVQVSFPQRVKILLRFESPSNSRIPNIAIHYNLLYPIPASLHISFIWTVFFFFQIFILPNYEMILGFRSSPSKFSLLRKTTSLLWVRNLRLFHRSFC